MGSHCVSELDRVAWIGRSTIQDAACLTLVRDSDLGRVAESFGAVTSHGRSLDIDEFCEEAFAYQEKHPMIALRVVGDWTLVVEDSGDQGSRPEVLRRVARPEAVSCFWDEDRRTRFAHAVDGVIHTSFEAVLPEYREGTHPDGLEEHRAHLPWSEGCPVQLMLALAGRLTGVVPSADWLSGEFCTYPVAPWPDDLVSLPLGDLDGYPAEMLTALRSAGEPEQRRVLRSLARYVATTADCLDLPVVQRILAGTRPTCSEVDETVRELVWRGIWERPALVSRNRLHAMQVLREVMHDDPRSALSGVLTSATAVRGAEPAAITAIVRDELA
ncbi:hypothetical protein EIL87_14805 [Saccharopolyspora rhizosphaerae]|uniref:Uncharacterized protein n=1 Tax=Saccharopolyspora rhizosphaerae TaxID=2492662 RepID=A0A426JT06_9PSEU|nr:DUF6461 domain-containing protein [Saccharopolyspora rhizosphaerae]RRO16300.1 hypothetical protein EIL87_14805 [Saccharopolyspora rhizosphaerae]